MTSTKRTNSPFDRTKAEAFAGTLMTALNQGSLCLMVSVGHRTGLFDVMSQMTPATSEGIATRAGLNERWEERTRDYLQKAGFRSITTRRLAHDIQNNWYFVTK